MHKPWRLSIIVVVFGFFSLASPAHAIDGSIKLTSPNGGETWKEGETHTITWESSSNIDKVNIGYSSGPGHLDWVVFTTPNTGSYSWNVNVGNTTNTQFTIEITGYETGAGSLSDKSDGTLTILQKEESAAPTPSNSSSSPKSDSWTKLSTRPTPTPVPTPIPTPKPPTLTYKSVILWEEFYFDGSQTTDLKSITDPKQVERFTLDTLEGFTFVFQEALDLTKVKTLQALADIDEYWVFESWFIWIKTEWWVEYAIDTPIKVTYENQDLTAFTPTIVQKEEPKQEAVKETYMVLGAKNGAVELEVTGGAQLKIEPRVELAGDAQITSSENHYTFTGKTSHKNLQYSTKINGTQQPMEVTDLNHDSGEFKSNVGNFVKGANFIQFYYQDGEQSPVLFAERTVFYTPSLWAKYKNTIGLCAVILGSMIIGAGIKSFIPTIRLAYKRVLEFIRAHSNSGTPRS